MKKDANEVISGDNLDILIGSKPLNLDDKDKEDLKIVKEIIDLIIIAKTEIINLIIEMVKDHLTEIIMADH